MTEPSRDTERVEVAREGDVPERGGLAVHVGDIEIGVFRVEGGYLAIENACPHAGVPLSTGDVEGCIVTCPAHGFQYDLQTGFAADFADGFPIPRFEVTCVDGALFIAAEREEDGALVPRPLPRARPASSSPA